MIGGARLSNSSACNAALFYIALGEKDKAFTELNRSYENRETSFLWLRQDPLVDALRDDLHLTDLMRRVGFSSNLEA